MKREVGSLRRLTKGNSSDIRLLNSKIDTLTELMKRSLARSPPAVRSRQDSDEEQSENGSPTPRVARERVSFSDTELLCILKYRTDTLHLPFITRY